MVHTRHSRDVEVDSPPRFLSLEDKRSRKSRSHAADVDGHDSDQSGIVYQGQGKDHSIFEEKVVESRLRPRTGPRRAYNYVYADSSDDEMMSQQRRSRITEDPFKVSRRGNRRHEVHHAEPEHTSEDEEEKDINRWHSTKCGRRQTRSRQDSNRHDEPDGEVLDEEDDDDEDLNNSAVRRSSRLRQKPYRFRASAQGKEKVGEGGSLDRGKRRRSDDPNNSNEEYDDMYSRVKRSRTKKGDGEGRGHSASNSDGTNDDDKNDSEDETQQRRSYSLREHKPRTQLYIAPAIEAIKKKPKQQSLFRETPPRRIHKQASYRSPAHRRSNFRKREAFHGSSSSTSSDSSDSGTETSDEQRFNRRKAKSMAKARSRICPLNFTADMMSSSGVLKDRVRTGASLADVDPMEIDKSVTFESVGGLQKHIMTLKEMVVFPLLYPEFYERFKVAPSRGVLFYGPPGTGKTLVARALANECSRGTQRVAFFMRKGADCLSKWVGEAERQLRLLFDKAYEMRPSIIFFDEIDGLAPVRSSRQDQIHSSIVSTLLALMDGIDSRGEIVVIGATNRIDSIDPALRRPGRFDREFHFPLPNLEERKKILKIHTKNWNPPLRDDFLSELAEKCPGYCGADIKCLVTEATQNALRRHYPQIYTTSDKLQLDVSSITLTARDFAEAVNTIVPAAQRAVSNPAMALEASVRPLLSVSLMKLQTSLFKRFPYSKLDRRANSAAALQGSGSEGVDTQGMLDFDLASDEEESMPSIFLPSSRGSKSHAVHSQSPASFLRISNSFPIVFRPRMLVSGAAGQGQSVHLAPAALHLMEHLPVHTLSSATLFAASAKMPEEACANVFHEAKRTAPSVIYMPYINELWGVVSDSLRVTFLTLVRSMNPSTPVLLLATSETVYRDLDDQLKMLFRLSGGEVVEVHGPSAEERHQFFADLILCHAVRPPPTHKQAERCHATQDSFHFFPQELSPRQSSSTYYEQVEGFPPGSITELCQAEDCKVKGHRINPRSKQTREDYKVKGHSINPRSKQTRVLGVCGTRSVRDIQGSGGEGAMVTRAPRNVRVAQRCQGTTAPLNIAPCFVPMPRVLASKTSASSHCKVNQFYSSRIIATTAPTLLPVPSTSRAEHLLFKMTPQSRVSSHSQYNSTNPRKLPCERKKKSAAVKTPARRRGGAKCTAVKGKRKNNLNYNHSACSTHAPNSRTSTRAVYVKRYPSIKSPYNKKAALDEKTDVYANLLVLNASPHWLRSSARRVLEPLAKAPPPEPRKLTDKEQRKLIEQEDDTLRELRIFLRDILSKLGREKKFGIFTKPVDIEEVPDYYEIIKNPMDLSTMMSNIDLHKYSTASAFLDDIFLICSNALEYNPDRGPTDRAIRHRACSLRDMAQALLKAELDPEFERLCHEITQSRKLRGIDSSKSAPAFYRTRPLDAINGASCPQLPSEQSAIHANVVPEGCRYSRRVRGLEADRTLPLEAVERTAQVEKTLLAKSPEKEQASAAEESPEPAAGHAVSGTGDEPADSSSSKVDSVDHRQSQDDSVEVENRKEAAADLPDCKCPGSAAKSLSPIHSKSTPKGSSSSYGKHSSSSAAKKAKQRNKCPWLSTRRRRRPYSHSRGNENTSPRSDVGEHSCEEPMDIVHSPTTTGDDGWARAPRSCREHSPMSAANPANVNVPSSARTRSCSSSNDNIPISQQHEASSAAEVSKQKGSFSSPAGGDVGAKPLKAGAARSLDMDLMIVATDSGLGSESNGDSRDSLDHNNSNRSHGNVDGQTRESGEEETAATTSPGPSFARTRSRTQNPLQLSALAALEAEARSVQVDKERLGQLLSTVVAHTKGFTVERLQHLYSVLSCAIYNHRHHFDKTQLVQEMEDIVENFCQEIECH